MKNFFNQIRIRFDNFIQFTHSSSAWYFYIILISVIFILSTDTIRELLFGSFFFNPYKYFGNPPSKEILFQLIDTRIINISAIFSISFIIIGFLINNLKKYSHSSYDLIYKNIKLFPILYSSLSLIGLLILISLFRNSFSYQSLLNIIYLGTFLILTVILLIGFLFKRVIDHINPQKVLVHYELEILRLLRRNRRGSNNNAEIRERKRELDELFVAACRSGSMSEIDNIREIYLNLIDQEL